MYIYAKYAGILYSLYSADLHHSIGNFPRQDGRQASGICFIWTAGLGRHQHATTMAGSRILATNQRQIAIVIAVIPHKHWLWMVYW